MSTVRDHQKGENVHSERSSKRRNVHSARSSRRRNAHSEGSSKRKKSFSPSDFISNLKEAIKLGAILVVQCSFAMTGIVEKLAFISFTVRLQ
jgi:hypothetical protein